MESIQKQRADRIQEEIPILQLLFDYGYEINPDNFEPQQFSCDLHGGADRKPSGRVYPETNSWYCWGCGKGRDAIETVRSKEEVSFIEACRILEKKYKLPDINWGSADYDYSTKEEDFVLKKEETLEEQSLRLHKLLDFETQEKELPLEKILSLWEAFDHVAHLIKTKTIAPAKASLLLEKLKGKLFEVRGLKIS